ncbi:hypothetical protein SMICM304S_12095 [Streptomyces microflavus]
MTAAEGGGLPVADLGGADAVLMEELAAFVAGARPVRSMDPLTSLHRVEGRSAGAGASEAYPGALRGEGALLTAPPNSSGAPRALPKWPFNTPVRANSSVR